MPAWKALASLALLPPLASAMPVTHPGELYAHIVQVDCLTARGTAFQIADGRYITAAHVSSNLGCEINGRPIEAVTEKGLDFAILKAGPGKGFPIDCDGFRSATYVFSVGYARGDPWQTMHRHLVTYKSTGDGLRILLGPHGDTGNEPADLCSWRTEKWSASSTPMFRIQT